LLDAFEHLVEHRPAGMLRALLLNKDVGNVDAFAERELADAGLSLKNARSEARRLAAIEPCPLYSASLLHEAATRIWFMRDPSLARP
jgi:hypothetical protein